MMSHGYSSTTPSPNDEAITGNKLILPTEESMNVMVLGTDYAVFLTLKLLCTTNTFSKANGQPRFLERYSGML
jgi:hypothetical protein